MPQGITVETTRTAEINLAPVGKQGIAMQVSGGTGGIPYEGPYTVTPSDETQILNTRQKMASKNITINPIPNNYGKIDWDGGVLTVS